MKAAAPAGAAALQSIDCTKYNRYGFTAKGQDCANAGTGLCQFDMEKIVQANISSYTPFLLNRPNYQRRFSALSFVLLPDHSIFTLLPRVFRVFLQKLAFQQGQTAAMILLATQMVIHLAL